MLSNTAVSAGRSPLTIAAGFLGAFAVGSLAVQLVLSHKGSVQVGAAGVDPVIATPATLWADLGARDFEAISAQSTPSAAVPAAINVEPVVGSEATLWAPFGDR